MKLDMVVPMQCFLHSFGTRNSFYMYFPVGMMMLFLYIYSIALHKKAEKMETRTKGVKNGVIAA